MRQATRAVPMFRKVRFRSGACRTQASLLFGVAVINSKKALTLLQDAITAQGQLLQYRQASTAAIDLPPIKPGRSRYDAITMAPTDLDMLDFQFDLRIDSAAVSPHRLCEALVQLMLLLNHAAGS